MKMGARVRLARTTSDETTVAQIQNESRTRFIGPKACEIEIKLTGKPSVESLSENPNATRTTKRHSQHRIVAFNPKKNFGARIHRDRIL
jgi:hypothetical protein